MSTRNITACPVEKQRGLTVVKVWLDADGFSIKLAQALYMRLSCYAKLPQNSHRHAHIPGVVCRVTYRMGDQVGAADDRWSCFEVVSWFFRQL